jgi:hypothetical protein
VSEARDSAASGAFRTKEEANWAQKACPRAVGSVATLGCGVAGGCGAVLPPSSSSLQDAGQMSSDGGLRIGQYMPERTCNNVKQFSDKLSQAMQCRVSALFTWLHYMLCEIRIFPNLEQMDPAFSG